MVAQPTSAPNLITRDCRGPLEAQAGNIVRATVEQTFGCLQRYRRLRVDDEISHDTSRQMTVLASVFMIAMRLQRALNA